MCGIAGGMFWSHSVERADADAAVRAMVRSLAHRGPDGVGVYSPSSGSWGAPSGVGMFYKFLATGQYEKGVLLQSTLYNCTMSVLGYQRVTIRVNGSTFELRSPTHKMKSDVNCVQKNN